MNNLLSSIIVSPFSSSSLIGEYDYYILSKGSENRSYVSCRQIDDTIHANNIIIFDSQMNQDGLDPKENEQYNSVIDILEAKKRNYITISAENT